MNSRKYKWILYTIVITILVTIGVQGYWNYNNYLVNKQNFSNEVQQSLDNALEKYYADLAQHNQFSILTNDMPKEDQEKKIDSFFKNIKFNRKGKLTVQDSVENTEFPVRTHKVKKEPILFNSIKVERNTLRKGDTITKWLQNNMDSTHSELNNELKLYKTEVDSTKFNITSIFISFHEDTLNYKKLDTFMQVELKRRSFDIPYSLTLKKEDTVFSKYKPEIKQANYLSAMAKSTFLKDNEKLQIFYPNATWIIVKYSLWGIIISFLLSGVIVGCLFYLLKIIKEQKELSEIKDDFISNITHEFKTPIATINAALEGMSSFNVLNDKAKAERYVQLSQQQLGKLTQMVEKILETATLETSEVKMNREKLNVSLVLEQLIMLYKNNHPECNFDLHMPYEEITATIDKFHFENALSNILDNAVKYGGNQISMVLLNKAVGYTIVISDNGGNLSKEQASRVFEKFYRVPKGNVHNVKGFGIGLYYTKTIVERHGGTIAVTVTNSVNTTFEIMMPYD